MEYIATFNVAIALARVPGALSEERPLLDRGIGNFWGLQTPWILHLKMPKGVLVEKPYNVSLVDTANGRAGLLATDSALSLQPDRQNTASIGFYVNATSMVRTWSRLRKEKSLDHGHDKR